MSVDDLREYVFGREDRDTSQSQMRASVAVGQGLDDLRVDRELECSEPWEEQEEYNRRFPGVNASVHVTAFKTCLEA